MLTKRLALGVAFYAALSAQLPAVELANVFGSEEDQAFSREASAEALKALELTFVALQVRELSESTGSDQLLEASTILFSAVAKMRILIDQGIADFDLNAEDISFIEAKTGGIGERYEGLFQERTTFVQIFSDYTTLGEILASSLKQAAGGTEGGSALSLFSTQLSDFILMGDAITVLGRTRLQ